MVDKNETPSKVVDLRESFNGANKISPKNDDVLIKSFNNANNIAPPIEDATSATTANTADQATPAKAKPQVADTSGDDIEKP